jgi:hypothetical protein
VGGKAVVLLLPPPPQANMQARSKNAVVDGKPEILPCEIEDCIIQEGTHFISQPTVNFDSESSYTIEKTAHCQSAFAS